MHSEKRRFHILEKIAEDDTIYQVWHRSYCEAKEAFTAFANSQPENIRNLLFAYADCGRLALQREINLACRYMLFPDEQ